MLLEPPPVACQGPSYQWPIGLIYILFIRSILEFAAPLWTGALTQNKKLTLQIQRVQNYICRIIRPDLEPSETEAQMNLCSLESRRIDITRKFAKGMTENPEFAYLFQRNTRVASRSYNKLIPPKWNTRRFGYSSLPFFARLLGQQDQYS